MQFTHSEENYLKAIFHLEKHQKDGVSTNAIAEQLDTKPSSVTDMVQKLADKDMLTYVKYKGTSLTDAGRKKALSVIRKHRLWETFLVEKLGFSWDQVHEIAEQLEHIRSEELINRLDALLEYPKTDPHGDPIPDKDGKFKKTEKKLLKDLKVSEKGICIGVKNSDSSFLKYLNKKNIAIGTEVLVLAKEDFDHSLQVKVGEATFFVSKQISENLYIQTN